MSRLEWQIVQTVLLFFIGIPFLINFPDVTKAHEILMSVMIAWIVATTIKQNYKFMKPNPKSNEMKNNNDFIDFTKKEWKPTLQLQWSVETIQSPYSPSTHVRRPDKKTLQQLWVDDDGNEEWRDVPTIN